MINFTLGFIIGCVIGAVIDRKYKRDEIARLNEKIKKGGA